MSMIGCLLQISPEQLQLLIDDPSLVEPFICPNGEEQTGFIDVDKAWQGIHFLLAGDPWNSEAPLANAVTGGVEVGDDVGYGAARDITADQVTAVAEALRDLSRDDLAKRFDAVALQENDIYPEIWDEGGEALDYLLSFYDTLREYYLKAAADGNAMLKYLN